MLYSDSPSIYLLRMGRVLRSTVILHGWTENLSSGEVLSALYTPFIYLMVTRVTYITKVLSALYTPFIYLVLLIALYTPTTCYGDLRLCISLQLFNTKRLCTKLYHMLYGDFRLWTKALYSQVPKTELAKYGRKLSFSKSRPRLYLLEILPHTDPS
jgi:hypothetical protein